MTDIQIAKLGAWPFPTTEQRRRSQFKAGWPATFDLLRYELERLKVSIAALEMDVMDRDLRRDGGVRADAIPSTPRILLAFNHPELGGLKYPCDTYLDWQDNVRAVALTLEALRAVDRYGATARAQQYAGFKALPSMTGATMTVTRAAELVVQHSGESGQAAVALKDPDVARRWARAAIKRTHPDKGGRREDFEAVQTARRVLTAHHGAEV